MNRIKYAATLEWKNEGIIQLPDDETTTKHQNYHKLTLILHLIRVK